MGEWKKANFKFLCNCSCSNIWFVVLNNPEQSDFPPKGIWFQFHLCGARWSIGDHGRTQARGPEGWSDAASLCWPFAIGVHENVDMLHKSWAKLIQTPAKQAVCTKCASHQLTDVSCCSCCSETIVVRERQPPPPVWAAAPPPAANELSLWHLLLLPWKLLSCHRLSSAALLPG